MLEIEGLKKIINEDFKRAAEFFLCFNEDKIAREHAHERKSANKSRARGRQRKSILMEEGGQRVEDTY